MSGSLLFAIGAVESSEALVAALDTPFGLIELRCAADGHGAGGKAPVAFRTRSCARILAWDRPEFRAELLLVDLAPELPPGMVLGGCRAGLWRVRATAPIESCVFEARWPAGQYPRSGGPASGSCLSALTWDDARTVVALGAPDAEGLALYERAGLPLSAAWRALILVDDPSTVVIEEYLPDGLRVRLPALQPGEVGQLHFAAAWADAATQPDAPWFAVDLSPTQVLGALDAAV